MLFFYDDFFQTHKASVQIHFNCPKEKSLPKHKMISDVFKVSLTFFLNSRLHSLLIMSLRHATIRLLSAL